MNVDWTDYCSDRNRIREGNRVELLVDGEQTMSAMIDAIRSAERYVSVATYIFADDATGRRLLDALMDARGNGAEVRVIYDGAGSFLTEPELFRPLRELGGEVAEYKPIRPWRKRFALWRRLHRKLLVVDGAVGFCGGMNFHDEAMEEERGGSGWHDVGARIEGPAVRDLHAVFLDTWRRVRGHPRSRHALLAWPDPAGDLPVAVFDAGGRHRGRRRRRIHRAYMHAIKTSRRSIHIWNPYFVPHLSIRRALRNACRRGVDVKVVVPIRGDHPAVQLAGEHLYARLMRQGVRIFRWSGPMMHAKTAVIDSVWSTVGSYNMDSQSYLHNLELNVTVYGRELGERMESLFSDDLERCVEVEESGWRARPLVNRALEWIAFWFRKWL